MEDKPQLTPSSSSEINQKARDFLTNFKGKMNALFGRKAIILKEQPEDNGNPSEKMNPQLTPEERLELFAKINSLVQGGDFEREKEIPVTKEGGVDLLVEAELLKAQEGISLHELNAGDVVYWTGPQGQRYYYLIEEPYEDRSKDILGRKGRGSLQINELDESGNPIQEVVSGVRIYGSNIGNAQAVGRIVGNCGVELAVLNEDRTRLYREEYERLKSSGKPVLPESQMSFNIYDTAVSSPVESFGVIRAEKIQQSTK